MANNKLFAAQLAAALVPQAIEVRYNRSSMPAVEDDEIEFYKGGKRLHVHVQAGLGRTYALSFHKEEFDSNGDLVAIETLFSSREAGRVRLSIVHYLRMHYGANCA